ncbi:hypothetical protein BD779DRAFT_115731 [Infundibulicybe gibba]|nr:hypothetical protein BD779DRAFT_115731 [Infundibulicybe gibba]
MSARTWVRANQEHQIHDGKYPHYKRREIGARTYTWSHGHIILTARFKFHGRSLMKRLSLFTPLQVQSPVVRLSLGCNGSAEAGSTVMLAPLLRATSSSQDVISDTNQPIPHWAGADPRRKPAGRIRLTNHQRFTQAQLEKLQFGSHGEPTYFGHSALCSIFAENHEWTLARWARTSAKKYL